MTSTTRLALMDRIVTDPSIRGGRPVIRGTRVTVSDILFEIARGAVPRQLIRQFPLLNEEDVQAALAYAMAHLDEGTREEHMVPRLSVVLVVYDMPEQAKRTLHSLSVEYQRDVSWSDYEVIVVENPSDRLLGEETATSTHCNVRYFQGDGAVSPVSAANFGAAQARAPVIAMMIDGARMLSPGVLKTALAVQSLGHSAVVSVPGYHLGGSLQQEAVGTGYDEATEARLLESIGWPRDGYRLFDIACFSGSCRGGFFQPLAESNFLCVGKDIFHAIGGYDSRFDLPGGGHCNLDLYKRVCEHPGTSVYVTLGEGTFHQFHGGVTTGGRVGESREAFMKAAGIQYRELRGEHFRPPSYNPVYIGAVAPNVRRFVHQSARPWAEQRARSTPPAVRV